MAQYDVVNVDLFFSVLAVVSGRIFTSDASIYACMIYRYIARLVSSAICVLPTKPRGLLPYAAESIVYDSDCVSPSDVIIVTRPPPTSFSASARQFFFHLTGVRRNNGPRTQVPLNLQRILRCIYVLRSDVVPSVPPQCRVPNVRFPVLFRDRCDIN